MSDRGRHSTMDGKTPLRRAMFRCADVVTPGKARKDLWAVRNLIDISLGNEAEPG
jgi:hypothetical protein